MYEEGHNVVQKLRTKWNEVSYLFAVIYINCVYYCIIPGIPNFVYHIKCKI